VGRLPFTEGAPSYELSSPSRRSCSTMEFAFGLSDDPMTRFLTLALLPSTSRSRPFVELRQSLPSQVEAIEPFVEQLVRFISKFRSPDGSETDIELALHEALANAVIHGNGENPYKRVSIACRCSIDGEVSITIRDQGQGFDTRTVTDPTASESLLATHGRGIFLMQVLMDEVYFDEGGVVVHMRKRPNVSSAAGSRSE
jgi:serine/threonine-protein kinase RsbW